MVGRRAERHPRGSLFSTAQYHEGRAIERAACVVRVQFVACDVVIVQSHDTRMPLLTFSKVLSAAGGLIGLAGEVNRIVERN